MMSTVWIVAASLLAVLAGLAAAWWLASRLNRQRRAAVGRQAAAIGQLLAQARQAQDEIDREAQSYPHEPPPFYRSTFASLNQARQAVARAIARHGRTLDDLVARAPPTPAHPLRRFFAVLGVERRFWCDQAEAFQTLDRLVHEQVVSGLEQGRELLRELRAKPLELASAAGQLRRALDQALHIAAGLQARGVVGDTFAVARAQVQSCRRQLDADPIGFFVQDSQATIVRQATLEGVQQALDALLDIQAPAEASASLFEAWQAQYDQLRQRLAELEEVRQQVALRLKAVPPAIDVSGLSAAWERVEALAPGLIERYATLPVQALQQTEELVQVINAGQEAIRQIGRAESCYWQLCETVQRMVTALREVHARMVETAQAPAYPLAWGEYPIVFSQLAQSVTEIGVIEAPRPPEQIEQDVPRATALAQRVDARRAEAAEIVAHYQALVSRLKSPELGPDRGWLARAEQVWQQSRLYAPQNWPRDLAVHALQDDMAALDQWWRQWVPEMPDEPIPAAQIGQRVEQVTSLREELARFCERLAQIETRLATMQQAEASAMAQLQEVGPILAQFEQLTARVQPPLDEALERQRSRILDCRRSLRDQVKVLERKDRNKVEQRVGQVSKWLAALNNAWAAWSNALQADLAQGEQQLEDDLQRLHEIAPFDAEPAVATARELVSGQLSRPTGGLSRPTGGLSRPTGRSTQAQEESMASQIERTRAGMQRREQLARAGEDVRRTLWLPIEKAARRVDETRQEALDRFAELQALAQEQSDRANWPFATGVQAIAALLEETVERENRLRDDGSKVARVSQALAEFEAQYRRVIAQAENELKSMRSKRQALETLLAQIASWQADLEAYRRHTDDREVERGIRARLDQIAGELDRLQRRARGAARGRYSMPYDELEAQLEQIKTQARSAVPYGHGSRSIAFNEIASWSERSRRERR